MRGAQIKVALRPSDRKGRSHARTDVDEALWGEHAVLKGHQGWGLGRLRSFKGSQAYAVPAGVDLENYGSVVIWCEKFAVLIYPATLSFY